MPGAARGTRPSNGLERAYRQRDGGLVAVLPWVSPVKWNPVFLSMHDDPRYTALLGRINLPVD
jgi:hypothetical protein